MSRHTAYPDWPGPFYKRTQRERGLDRPAVWLTCAHCGQLFLRPVAWLKDTRAGSMFCSISCGRQARPRKVFTRRCTVCHRQFTLVSSQRKNTTCSRECAYTRVTAISKERRNRATTIYLASRGFSNITCDYCGRGQYYVGRVIHRGVFVTHLDGNRANHQPGNLAAICKNCMSKKTHGTLGPRLPLPVKERFA